MSGQNANKNLDAPESAVNDTASEPARGEIIIEVNSETNDHLIFGPRGKRPLRGRWDRHRLPPGTTVREGSKMLTVPVIPGLYICADVQKRTVRVVDPLSFKTNRELLAKASAALDRNFNPVPKWEQTNLNDDQLASFVDRMRRAVEAKHATVVQLPGDAWPKLKGQVRADYFNSYRRAKTTVDELLSEEEEEEGALV